MLVLLLLLVLATAAFTAVVVVENFSGGPEYTVEVFGNQIATLGAPGLFLSGVALALIFCLGLAALAGGLKRRRHHKHPARVSEPVAATGEERETRRAQPPAHGHRRIFGH
ncbi:hypothetical protein ACH4VX_19010 [Streptomyces sp. NPDC020731]|uniref:hypothetical protein n=1 Tax=Streptomyces sp. NPDC020731 TaxID=3365085 RepID=UPI0037AEDCC1